MPQFGRKLVLEVIDRAAGGDPVSDKELKTTIDTSISDFKVEFNFTKYLDFSESTNTGSVTIHNLSAETVKGFGKKYSRVKLYVGYVESAEDAQLLFEGDVTGIEFLKAKGSTTCKLEVSAYELLLNHEKKLSVTYPEKSTLVDVLTGSMKYFDIDQVGYPQNDAAKQKIFLETKFPLGISLSGSAKEVLDQILRPRGYNWAMLDTKTILITDSTEVSQLSSGDNTIVLTEDTGLIGFPYMKTQDYTKSVDEATEDNELFLKDKEGKPAKDGTVKKAKKKVVRRFGVEFKALINPAVIPNSVIRIGTQAGVVDGLYRVREVKFSGDTRGQNWYMDCFAENIGDQ